MITIYNYDDAKFATVWESKDHDSGMLIWVHPCGHMTPKNESDCPTCELDGTKTQ